MNIEIIIRDATLTEAKELLAAIPEGTPIKVIRPDPAPDPQSHDIPVEVVHARIVEVKKSKKQIPFSYKTETKQYQNAWNLCKKWGLPYPEAVIKQAEEDTAFNKGQIKKPSPVTTKPPEPETPATPAPVTMDTIPKTESVVGWKVKQIKPDRGRQVPGNLMVTARRNGLIECMYEGKRQIIDAKCLSVVRVLETPSVTTQ